MSINCKDPNIVGCVENDLALGLASANSLTGGCVALFVLFVTYHGFLSLSGSRTFYEMMLNLWYGATAFTGKSWKLGASVAEAQKSGRPTEESTMVQRALYLISAITVAVLGWFLAEDKGFGIMLFCVVFITVFLLYTSGKIEAAIVQPLVGGLLFGLMIAVIIWAAKYFTVRRYNTFGDTFAILLGVYLFLGSLAWYGYAIRRRPGAAGRLGDGRFMERIDGRRKTGPNKFKGL